VTATWGTMTGMQSNDTDHAGRLRLEVTLTHEAASYAATQALKDMGPVRADGALVSVPVDRRDGAIMEAARRLARAGVGAHDLVLR
jgi:hypothetical protein